MQGCGATGVFNLGCEVCFVDRRIAGGLHLDAAGAMCGRAQDVERKR